MARKASAFLFSDVNIQLRKFDDAAAKASEAERIIILRELSDYLSGIANSAFTQADEIETRLRKQLLERVAKKEVQVEGVNVPVENADKPKRTRRRRSDAGKPRRRK